MNTSTSISVFLSSGDIRCEYTLDAATGDLPAVLRSIGKGHSTVVSLISKAERAPKTKAADLPLFQHVEQPIVVPEPVIEPVVETIQDVVPETVPEIITEPVQDIVPEPVVETIQDVVPETVPEPVDEPVQAARRKSGRKGSASTNRAVVPQGFLDEIAARKDRPPMVYASDWGCSGDPLMNQMRGVRNAMHEAERQDLPLCFEAGTFCISPDQWDDMCAGGYNGRLKFVGAGDETVFMLDCHVDPSDDPAVIKSRVRYGVPEVVIPKPIPVVEPIVVAEPKARRVARVARRTKTKTEVWTPNDIVPETVEG